MNWRQLEAFVISKTGLENQGKVNIHSGQSIIDIANDFRTNCQEGITMIKRKYSEYGIGNKMILRLLQW